VRNPKRRLQIAIAGLILVGASARVIAQDVASVNVLTVQTPAALSDTLLDQQGLSPNRQTQFNWGMQWLVPEEEALQAAQKDRLLNQLKTSRDGSFSAWAKLRGQSVGGTVISRAALFARLQALPVSGRVLLPSTNPLAMEAKPSINPLLEPGQQVVIPPLIETVSVVRGDGSICTVPFRAGVMAKHYVWVCAPTKRLNLDWAWVIQPDGQIAKVPISSWNLAPQTFPAPGSWIWAPSRKEAYTEAFSWEMARFLATLGVSGTAQNERLFASERKRIDNPMLLSESYRDLQYARFLPLIPNDFGTIGLLQTPTARMAPEGQVALSYSNVYPYQRYNLLFQPLSWFEFGFRYTRIDNRIFGGPASDPINFAYQDKSIPLKFKLLNESYYLPQVAVGFTDIGGTGLFGGEYLVTNKRYQNFDFSLGLGWGYNGARGNLQNPLSVFGGRFNTRQSNNSGSTGGEFNSAGYFTGPTALFGGVQYHSPIDRLVLKAELDGNNYQNEPLGNIFKVNSPLGSNYPINVGATYMWDYVYLSVGFERGNKAMVSLTITDNLGKLNRSTLAEKRAVPVERKPIGLPNDNGNSARSSGATGPSTATPVTTGIGPNPNTTINPNTSAKSGPNGLNTNPSSQVGAGVRATSPAGVSADLVNQYPALLQRLSARSGWDAVRLSGNRTSWWVDFENVRAIYINDTLNEVIAILHEEAPNTIVEFKIRMLNKDLQVVEYAVNRKQWMLTQTQFLPPSARKIPSVTTQAFSVQPRVSPSAPDLNGVTSPELEGAFAELATRPAKRYDYGFGLGYQQIFGGPNNFGPIFAINATANGTAKLWTGAWASGTLSLQGPNNLSHYRYTYSGALNPGNVPRVRTYLQEYWDSSLITMPNLQLTQVKQLQQNHFVSAYGGYLEWMFGGVGGEYLYRPVSSPLAFGVDLNRVKQRDFQQNFNFLSPSYLVNTGHATVYWDTGWQNILTKVSAGQYLAGDRGGTFDISKVFANGMQIGAYFTKTNMSSINYGEGSNDKGIYFTIPFDAFLTKRTNAVATFMYQPYYKDGGAFLQRKYRLYDLTRMRDQRALSVGAGDQTESLMPVQPF
jgi:hypothetical protein